MAIGHLLAIGRLGISRHQYYEYFYEDRENRRSLSSDVGCHEWNDGTRLVGVRSEKVDVIHPGLLPDYEELLNKHFEKLLRPTPRWVDTQGVQSGFYHLLEIGSRIFTEVPKVGERLDTGEPEFGVIKMDPVLGGPEIFRTTVGGYYGLAKYGTNEVAAIAPLGANAYTVGEWAIEEPSDPKHHVAPVYFWKVEVDTSKRLIRLEEIYRDYDLMMSFIEQ